MTREVNLLLSNFFYVHADPHASLRIGSEWLLPLIQLA